MSILELRRVPKVYGQGTAGVHALADVSLSVDEGSMVAVMGRAARARARSPACARRDTRNLSTQKQPLCAAAHRERAEMQLCILDLDGSAAVKPDR
jgi:hypothetical protein